MKKLDRLDWAESVVLSAFGVHVGLRVSVRGMMPRLLSLMPAGWKKCRRVVAQRLYSLVVGGGERPGLRRLHVLYADEVCQTRQTSLEKALDAMESDIHRYIAETSPDVTFLHAGVVGWRGHAVMFPGRSLSGKTTLVQEMLRLGATYYSDEFAVVDNRGLVYPFPRPLGIRSEGSYEQTKCAPEMLGAVVGIKPIPLGVAVITEYKHGAPWRPKLLTAAQGMLQLLANTVAVRSQPDQTLTRLHVLAKGAVFLTGRRGEACQAAASILKLFPKLGRRRII